LWRVKTRRNIHRGSIKNKNKYAFIWLVFSLHHRKYKNTKNIEKEIFAEKKNEKQSQRLWTTEA
jgi:hypothetical protein